MVDYLYDGSFEGLLTCIYLHYYAEKASGIYIQSCYQSNLLNKSTEVQTVMSYADKVYTAVHDKISKKALQNIYHVYLSSYDQKEMLILKYIVKGFKRGKLIDYLHSDPIVHDMHLYAKKVTTESHKFLGLIRFSDAKDFLYAEFEPDHDILFLLADHFVDRLRNEKFIIHDLRRMKALIYSNDEWYISDFKLQKELSLSEKEKSYRSLWKNYFNHIGISERKNPRVQTQYMPRRYWKHLTEL